MATKKERIGVILDPEDLALVKRAAVVFDVSLSGSIRMLMRQLRPGLLPMIEALELAREAPVQALRNLHGALSEASGAAAQLNLDMGVRLRELEARPPELPPIPKMGPKDARTAWALGKTPASGAASGRRSPVAKAQKKPTRKPPRGRRRPG